MLKSIKNVLAAAAFLGMAVTSANAATFNISFTQISPDLTGSGPDWFGTFEAPSTGGALTSFSATIDGVTYDVLYDLTSPTYTEQFTPEYNSTTNRIGGSGSGAFSGIVWSEVFDGDSPGLILNSGGNWAAFSSLLCNQTSCSPGDGATVTNGTYQISPVPLPAALPLLLSALGFFGFMGWRRKRLATA